MFRLKPYHEVLCYPTCQKKKHVYTSVAALYPKKRRNTSERRSSIMWQLSKQQGQVFFENWPPHENCKERYQKMGKAK